MSNLQAFICQHRKDRAILLMTHVVYGYPTIDASLALMRDLLSEGVELLEVQFPFTDPSADGPSILHACHQALQQRPTLARCLADIAALGSEFPASHILLMSYLNPLYRYGLERLPSDAANAGIAGLIIPDLPLELADDVRHSCRAAHIEPIWMLTPETPAARMQHICAAAGGMLYCVSRRGVTGGNRPAGKHNDNPQRPLEDYLADIRTCTQLPLAVGFGIRTGTQVQALHGLADIAVIGSGLLDAFNRGGNDAALRLVRQLRQ
jgi:tryptophan synthase alpha chain